MIKEITSYQCDDGSRFDLLKDAVKYETLCKKVNLIMKPLGKRPKKWKIEQKYIQHNPKDVKKAWHDFLVLCADNSECFSIPLMECAEDKRNINFADNILEHSQLQVINETDYRFRCISIKNGTGREYEQPYFINHENDFNVCQD